MRLSSCAGTGGHTNTCAQRTRITQGKAQVAGRRTRPWARRNAQMGVAHNSRSGRPSRAQRGPTTQQYTENVVNSHVKETGPRSESADNTVRACTCTTTRIRVHKAHPHAAHEHTPSPLAHNTNNHARTPGIPRGRGHPGDGHRGRTPRQADWGSPTNS
jgi:hypothetical protein